MYIFFIFENLVLGSILIVKKQFTSRNTHEIKRHLIDCITTILERSKLKKGTAFKTCVFILVKQIYDNNGHKIKKHLSEEMKLAVLQALSAAATKLQSDIVEEVYVKDNVHLISQVLYVCTEGESKH